MCSIFQRRSGTLPRQGRGGRLERRRRAAGGVSTIARTAPSPAIDAAAGIVTAKRDGQEAALYFPPVDGSHTTAGGRWHASRGGRLHEGQDFAARAGSVVHAAFSGQVLRVTNGSAPGQPKANQRAGLFVVVGRPLSGGRGLFAWYEHLGRADVEKGSFVRAGEAIGTVAPTGSSGNERSGPHLHFQVAIGTWSSAGLGATFFNPSQLPATFSAVA